MKKFLISGSLTLITLNLAIIFKYVELKRDKSIQYELCQLNDEANKSIVKLLQSNFYHNFCYIGIPIIKDYNVISSNGQIFQFSNIPSVYKNSIYLWYSDKFCQKCVASVFELIQKLPLEKQKRIIILSRPENIRSLSIFKKNKQINLDYFIVNDFDLFTDIENPCFFIVEDGKIVQFYEYSKELNELNKICINHMVGKD